jgi:hypothetical protein
MDDIRNSRNLKAYEKPTATELTREQAILTFRDHADLGPHAPVKSPGKQQEESANVCRHFA